MAKRKKTNSGKKSQWSSNSNTPATKWDSNYVWFTPRLELLEDRLAPATEIINVANLALFANDRTIIEIGGPQPGNPPDANNNNDDGYDQIQVANNASLN
ncbi:MAG: hypothetical protein EBV06_07055, partial [Planctomycetia bacterium]|nr:hypothetical protein [Planctomycetia bacterium]